MPICRCRALGCGAYPGGQEISARQVRQHEAEDRKQALRERTLELETRQAAAIARQEERMVNAMQALAVSDSGLEVAAEIGTKYRMDRVRKAVDEAGVIFDRIVALRSDFSVYHDQPTSVAGFLERQDVLDKLTADCSQMMVDLQLLKKTSKSESVQTMCDRALSELQRYSDEIRASKTNLHLARHERESRLKTSPRTTYDTEHHHTGILIAVAPVIQLVIFMVVVCNIVLGFPRRGCLWLFEMTHKIIKTAAIAAFESEEHFPRYLKNILKDFPRDIRTATAQFNLEAKSTIYAVCPTCHSTFAPTVKDNIPLYPEKCNFKKYGKNACGDLLVRSKLLGRRSVKVPIKPFVSYDFKEWLGSLLSRPGYETKMDRAWEEMATSADGKITSIFQGSVLRNFKGPDKEQHFSCGGDQGRYVFSLGFDFFNPLTNKQAGKRISVGVIALVCLNLPIELRHNPDNMFLAGIIPGPKEPPLDRINPFLTPIVDELLDLWDPGVFFTQTYNHLAGRLVLCALVAVICDLIAARKIGGFSACTHRYGCAVCWCPKASNAHVSLIPWQRRSNNECRMYAEDFRDAPNAKSARQIFNLAGLRWSELLRLPYFDPSRFVIIDSMHNLLLGLLKEHFSHILGFNEKTSQPEPGALTLHIPPEPSNPLPTKETDLQGVHRVLNYLRKPMEYAKWERDDVDKALKRLTSANMAALIYIAKGLVPGFVMRKKVSKLNVAREILEWRGQQDADSEDVVGDLGEAFVQSDLREIWKDIGRMVKPSWVTSVPWNLGSSTGKLKADEWRTIGSIYLPTTLIRLWSVPVQNDTTASERRQKLLELTTSLLSAVNIATSRETSYSNSAEYYHHMMAYRQGLVELFPDYTAHPNHHQALHIAEYLLMYGPVHGWWTFPFERMIGMLQRISTNYKPGEYEATIGQSWHRLSNLRALLNKTTFPQILRTCADMMRRLISLDVRDTSAANVLGLSGMDGEQITGGNIPDDRSLTSSAKLIPDNLRSAFPPSIVVPDKADFLSHLIIHGVRYSTSAIHEGNSCVLLEDSYGEDIPVSIQHILHFPGAALSESWVLVKRLRQPGVQRDPFLVYPAIRARMWSPSLSDTFEVVSAAMLKTHYAKCIVPWEHKKIAVVISLSKTLLIQDPNSSDEFTEPADT